MDNLFAKAKEKAQGLKDRLFKSSTYGHAQEWANLFLPQKENTVPQPLSQESKSLFQEPTPTPTSTPSEIERKIRAGFQDYSTRHAGGKKLPIEPYIPLFVKAAEKYPIFQKYPFLLPQVSILESSAGLNVSRENNPLNWAARIQKAGNYSPKSWEESINDAITAIAGDLEARPKGTPRGRQTVYYEPFRQTGDVKLFTDTYEPANKDYHSALTMGMDFFNKQ